MSNKHSEQKLEEMAAELAKGIKTGDDLSKLSHSLMKMTVEKAIEAEMEHHLGYEKHSVLGKNTGNNRNGHSKKILKSDAGEVELNIPRDRNGDFEPQLIKKRQTRTSDINSKILTLYAKGMTTRDIVDAFKEMYDVDVSHTLISKVTESVIEEVKTWQERPLEALYPIVYLDCIVVKVHQDRKIISKSVFIALGVNQEGYKELLGLWIAENEGAKFWMSILEELKQRGLKDIIIVCVDGLSGFPEAISHVFPQAQIQLCIVHMVRNSLKYVSWKDRKKVASDLRKIYNALNESSARDELSSFKEKWDSKYSAIGRSWEKNWENLITIFSYPEEIRKVIYTTNAIESLNSVIRKAIKNRRIFPNDDSAFKAIFLAIDRASRKWTMPLRDWGPAMNRFLLEYEGRIEL